jgi:hypothetical protein
MRDARGAEDEPVSHLPPRTSTWRPYIRGTGTFEDAAGAIIAIVNLR